MMTPTARKEKQMKISIKVKKVWDDSKGTVAIVAVASTFILAYIYGRHVGITNEFLEKHALTEEFYGF